MLVLRPLVTTREMLDAYRALKAQVESGAEPLERKVGHRGYSEVKRIHWRVADGFWAYLSNTDAVPPNRFWCAYGVQDPRQVSDLSITVETNPPLRGINRLMAGVFARDERGQVYLGHNGKIGGGRRGVGKTGFLAWYSGMNFAEVEWSPRERSRVIVLGPVDAPSVVRGLKQFVHAVDHFKRIATGQA